MKKIYTSIDIGSNSIKVVVAELFKGKLNILAVSDTPTSGIKRGLIINADDVSESLTKAINEVESILGFKIKNVLVNVPSNNAEYKVISGEVDVLEDNVVSEKDVINVLKDAVENNIPKDRELVTTLPIRFEVGDDKTSNPIGIEGNNLKVISMMITVPKKNVYSVINILNNLNIKAVDITINELSGYYCFRDEYIKDKIGVIVDIGHEKTNVGIITKDIITESKVLPIGSDNIDNDIAYAFNLNGKNKTIKESFALAHKRYANSNETLSVVNSAGNRININQYETSEVVMERIIEILEVAKKEINDLTNSEISYIIITGGITEIIGFKVLANEVFGNKYIEKNVQIIGVRNNKYSTVIGNICYFIDKLKLRDKRYSMVSSADEIAIVTNNKNNNVSNSVFSKIFGYFFEN